MEEILLQENRCLEWLLAHGDEILESNRMLDEAIERIDEMCMELTSFVDSISQYLISVSSINDSTTALLSEAEKNTMIAAKLREYLASIVISPEAECGIRSAPVYTGENTESSEFWDHVEELNTKLKTALSYNKADWKTLDDAQTQLMGLAEISVKRITRHIETSLKANFIPHAQIATSRRAFYETTKKAFDYLSINKSMQRPIIIKSYEHTLGALHMQQVQDYFQLIRDLIKRSAVVVDKYTLNQRFARLQLNVFDEALNGFGVADDSSVGLVRTLMDRVGLNRFNDLRIQDEGSTNPTSSTRVNESELCGPLEKILERSKILKEYDKPIPPLRTTFDTVWEMEDLYRMCIKALMDTGMAEMDFMHSYFMVSKEDVSQSEAVCESTAGAGLTSEASSSSLGFRLSWGSPLTSQFGRVFGKCLSKARIEIKNLLITGNWDLVSLTLMRRLSDIFLGLGDCTAAVKKSEAAFMESVLVTLSQCLNKQIALVTDSVLNTIRHNNKPTMVVTDSTDIFHRKGSSVLRNRLPHESTAPVLVQLLIILSISVPESDAVKQVKDVLQNSYENLDLNSPNERINLLFDMQYILTTLEESALEELRSTTSDSSRPLVLDDESDADVQGRLEWWEDMIDWAETKKNSLIDDLARTCISKIRPGLLETVHAAETQFENSGSITEPTRIKLARYTNVEFEKDLASIYQVLTPPSRQELTDRRTSYAEQKIQEWQLSLAKEIVTKYVVLHSRLVSVLGQAEINTGSLIQPSELLANIKKYFD
ncbi:Vps52/Sac2 family protein [Gregarina niphandrodes]|uniref:Vps52/Sac2 family protein n=1 Tax=Gregarina niphandrodes TaxID=110365 RepID=A0A023B4Q0_GRENI|nr:Vps52/Sac2 family protein [Gregarina niphandrodes]EZG56680.1 Vps52/Sac2 family protein [Gregarina niphandrodes]|eukprot:XP_011131210.1 Vps52/Sac2 family protein [Gregarina niphandrodes]